MISYQPFWNTLKERDVSTYTLIKKYNISSNRLTRMRKGLPLSTVSIDEFCRILHCKVEDIIEYVEEQE
ncbi:MAG: helix-turn-helix transcriptional regulator [Ruminiclostridium sp.]|jgi:putative transcriptional regulator|nr:helix-turn-helix transcriptional regulator [Ruminiclostridium sp.]